MTPDEDVRHQYQQLHIRDAPLIFIGVLAIVLIDTIMIVTGLISP